MVGLCDFSPLINFLNFLHGAIITSMKFLKKKCYFSIILTYKTNSITQVGKL